MKIDPWIARKLHKKKISKDSASVGDEPIFKALVETKRKRQECEGFTPFVLYWYDWDVIEIVNIYT